MHFGRFSRFAAVGAVGFLVDVAVLYGAFALGIGLYAGRILSFLMAATFTWFVNRRYTFSTAHPPSLKEWLQFVFANAGGGVVNYVTYAGLVTWVDIFLSYPALAVAAGSLSGLAVNYLASERLVFRRDPDNDARQG